MQAQFIRNRLDFRNLAAHTLYRRMSALRRRKKREIRQE